MSIQGSHLLFQAMESSLLQDTMNVKDKEEKQLLTIVPHISIL